jgi:hypothetical protein
MPFRGINVAVMKLSMLEKLALRGCWDEKKGHGKFVGPLALFNDPGSDRHQLNSQRGVGGKGDDQCAQSFV